MKISNVAQIIDVDPTLGLGEAMNHNIKMIF